MKDRMIATMRCIQRRYGMVMLPCITISLACYLPPVYCFTDAYLLPKWYLLIFAVGILVTQLAHSRFGRRVSKPYEISILHFACISFVFCSVIESIYVLTQTVPNGIPEEGVRGTFDNPCGLALNLSIAITIGLHLYKESSTRNKKAFYGIICLLLLICILLSKSRTGLLCLSTYLLIYTWSWTKKQQSPILVNWGKAFLFIIPIVSLLFVSHYKSSSTHGRWFILQRTWELIQSSPIVGHGWNGFEREYMRQQGKFFEAFPSSPYTYLADEIQHPLNEFAYLWVNLGIFGLLVFLLLFAIGIALAYKKKDIELGLSIGTLFTFSCFSYPSHYPITCLVTGSIFIVGAKRFVLSHLRNGTLGIVLMLAGVAMSCYATIETYYEIRWRHAYRLCQVGLRDKGLQEYAAIHNHFQRDKYFLYSYAVVAYKIGEFNLADTLLRECSHYWNGYNIELLSGDVDYNRGLRKEAIKHYETAYNMCPVRFAPLEGLYNSYSSIGDSIHSSQIAQRIGNKTVKIKSSEINEIKRNCSKP